MPHHSNLKHTPFDGSEPLFNIGLRPFAAECWLDIDDNFEPYLAEKKRLISQIPDKVFQAQDNTLEAQKEVLTLISDAVNKNHVATNKEGISLSPSLPPLLQAALMVQEDLVIMRQSCEGWRLVAGSVCFPSSWSLQEKFGMVLHDVHAPIPDFNKGTRNAGMIERIFNKLQIGTPVERFNWSVYCSDALYHDAHYGEQTSGGSEHFLRVERQTLTKLPKSGDILFTIRIYVDPFDALYSRGDMAEIALGFIGLLNKLTPAQLDYKGLDEGRGVLLSRLQELVDLA